MRAAGIRINCGSTEPFSDPDGRVWRGDRVAAAADADGRIGGEGVRRPDILPVHPAGWAGLLRSEAWGMSAYRFRIPDGTYGVRLVVAETHPVLTSLARRFAVAIDGVPAVSELTPAAVAGGFARGGEVRIRGVRVTGGRLELGFSPGANLAGLEIVPAAPGEAPGVVTAAWAPQPLAAPPAAPAARRVRLAFAGHSGTFYWAIPETVARLVALHRDAVRLDVAAVYAGGKGVRHFLESPAVGRLLAEAAGGLASLQDSSWGPLEQPGDFAEAMPRLVERARAAGARPVLYAYSGPLRHAPGQRREIQAAYDALGRDLGVAVVPCAAALAMAQEELPGLDLHDADRHHLGIAGGVLYACCWYRALCGPDAPVLADHAVLAGHAELPPELARRLAAIADRVCAGRGPGILVAA